MRRMRALSLIAILAICQFGEVATAQRVSPSDEDRPLAPIAESFAPVVDGRLFRDSDGQREIFYEQDHEGPASPQDTPKETSKTEKKAKAKKAKREKLKKDANTAYKGLFYDNNFGYLSDPDNASCHFGDCLKQIKLGCHGFSACTSCTGCAAPCDCQAGPMLDIGGQYRFRFHGERNHRGLGLTGRNDEFLLHRTRLFANLRVNKRLRFYGEYIDAVSEFENFAPRPIEENRSDLLNLFVDGTIYDNGQGKLIGRAGRQELLYGAQRAVSPLDWANTRRTFDGGKLIWKTDKLNIDGFWARPMRLSDRQFDNPNLDQQLYGIYSTYSAVPSEKLEAYWLAFDNKATGFHADSIGGRYYEEAGQLMFEAWGNYQFGDNSDGSSHDAGAWTVGLGHKSTRRWKPTWWVYYDWASGGNQLGTGDGYFHYLPLAHKYLGFMDLFGRRNLESPNVQFSIQPTKKLKLLTWYHYFKLENQNDTPYSVVMTPFAPAVAPGSDDLGHEIDFVASYSVSPRSQLLFGYSHFTSGDYYDTAGLPHSGNADFFYTQYHVNF